MTPGEIRAEVASRIQDVVPERVVNALADWVVALVTSAKEMQREWAAVIAEECEDDGLTDLFAQAAKAIRTAPLVDGLEEKGKERTNDE